MADPNIGNDEEPKRFGVRDLRNDTAAVLDEAERSGAFDAVDDPGPIFTSDMSQSRRSIVNSTFTAAVVPATWSGA